MKVKKQLRIPSISIPLWWPDLPHDWRVWLPSRGNVLFTLVMIAVLLWAQSAGAVPFRAESAASTGTIAYQGRLADSSGNPLTQTLNMSFRLYKAATGGSPLWTEQWTGSNGVQVSDGLFNVMLGSLTPIAQSVITGNSNLFLGITVGTDDEMSPRVQLGSVPFAVQALSVPDGSITTAKLAADVSLAPPTNSITTTMIANGAVTTAKLQQPLTDLRISKNSHLNVVLEKADDRKHMTLVIGGGGSGLRFSDTNYFFIGKQPYADRDDTSAGTILLKVTPSGSLGTTDVYGDFRVNGGSKSAVVQAGDFGQRALYAVEAPDVRFSDEGMAQLQNGQARIALEPIFLETIEGDFLIHITPYGDASLYVAEVSADYFVVKAREGDPNVSFAWRLSATRKGYAGVRLEEVENTDQQK